MGGLPSLPAHVVSKNLKSLKMSGNACGDMGNGGYKRQVGLDVMV